MLRFICVRLSRQEEPIEYCAFCRTAIGKTYVRDLDTRVVYHSHFCMEMHIDTTTLSLENLGRQVT